MKVETKIWATIAVMALILAVGIAGKLQAQDVKYCKNYKTGEIAVVQADMPCPYPMAEM